MPAVSVIFQPLGSAGQLFLFVSAGVTFDNDREHGVFAFNTWDFL